MTAPAPAMARRAVTRGLPRTGMDGALSVRAWLLAAGTAGGLVFTGVYLAKGATRAGYRTLAQPISVAVTSRPTARGRRLSPAAGEVA